MPGKLLVGFIGRRPATFPRRRTMYEPGRRNTGEPGIHVDDLIGVAPSMQNDSSDARRVGGFG